MSDNVMDRRSVPERYRAMYGRAMAGNSRKAALRVKCLECVGWSAAEVARCTAPHCPLYPYRGSADETAMAGTSEAQDAISGEGEGQGEGQQ